MSTNSSTKVVFTVTKYKEILYGSQDGWGGYRSAIVCNYGEGAKGYIYFYDEGVDLPGPGINEGNNDTYYGHFSAPISILDSMVNLLNGGNPVTYYLSLDDGTSGQAYLLADTPSLS